MSKPKSTNPFDSPDNSVSNKSNESDSHFYDCQEDEQGENAKQAPPNTNNLRSANINFEKPFDDTEAPALDFQKPISSAHEFFSPLESALMQLGNAGTGGVINSSFDSNLGSSEESPLLGDVGGGDASRATIYSDLSQSPGRKSRTGKIPTEISTERRKKSKSQQMPSVKTKHEVVLTELAGGENEFSMDYKYILLEDLGTKSSWLILLLPYFAFCVCLLLESSTVLTKSSATQPLNATNPCYDSIFEAPLLPVPTAPCHCSFQLKKEEAEYDENNSSSVWYDGYAFESGVVERIPVISTYLYGDAIFTDLSTESVALVAQGKLEASVQVLQQDLAEMDDWSVMYVSKPKTVSMACDKNKNGTWDCKTPRIIDIVFSMPETMVYAGGNIRVNIYYSIKETQLASNDHPARNNSSVDISHVYTKGKDAAAIIASIHSFENSLVENIVSSSEYTLEHMSYLAMKIDTGVRLGTFFISVCFLFYWLYNMGMKTLFSSCKCSLDYCFPKSKTRSEWWESHWILFPERYYILVLLLSLLLVQEPVLAAMVISPTFGSSARLHIAADATIGIGVHGVLFVYLCLFHGFRFHTATVSKKRAEHQRQILQLRRAAAYVNNAVDLMSPTERAVSKYTDDFYEIYGDIDGILSNNHRLENDPFGDAWADFLLLKILLFSVGVTSVISTAYSRFPPEADESFALDDESLNKYRTLFVVSSIVNFIVLLIWVLAIIKAAIVTGHHLRSEKFLSTRPVQLAYRIIFAHMTLGFVVLFVTFCLRIHKLAVKWSLHDDEDGLVEDVGDISQVETAIRVLSQLAVTFPYSGTAASVGAGRVFFATVSILITAFIFLPAHHLEEEEDGFPDQQNATRKETIQEKLQEQRRLKRDKRLVVHLAKESKTWRVFPLPIDQSSPTTMLEDNLFQIYKGLYTDDNVRERGVVSSGPYTPIFCLELACWLNEASWQAYYSPPGISSKTTGSAPGGMNLESLGLRLEGAVFDEVTDTQVYVATNMGAQVDGAEDSCIVVSFRGTANASNLQTDLRSRQVPLLDQLAGIGSAPFCVYSDRVEIADTDGWIWDTQKLHEERIQCVTSWTNSRSLRMPSHCARGPDEKTALNVVSKGARAILQATPVARGSFPLVHEGFQEVYTHIRKKLLDILFPVLQRQLAKSMKTNDPKEESQPLALPKIYVTGHSLGGSLAQLLALDLASNCEIVLPIKVESEAFNDTMPTPETEIFHLPDSYQHASAISTEEPRTTAKELRLQPPISVYTFGQPRLGNKPFTRLYKQRVPHTFRVVNEGDAITSMPNRYLFCSGVYKHAGLEVLLDEGMTGNILVGPTVVETIFRFSPVRTNMLAHTMTRYRDCLECAFEEYELLEYYQGHNVSKDDLERGNQQQSNSTKKAQIPEWMTQVGKKK